MDGILRFTLLDGTIRGALLCGTELVRAMRVAHGLGILETVALGQAYLCAALASVTAKDGDRISFKMDCTGALRGFSVDATWDGRVRGYLFSDSIALDKPLDSFDLSPFIGKGVMTVTRYSPEKDSFQGHVELVHGRIAEDFAEYYLRSEQTRTAFSAGVKFDSSGEVSGAGGLFLQAMPGAREVDVEDAEFRLSELPSLSDWYARGKGSGEFLSEWFGAFEPNAVGTGPALFSCDCSRDRFASFLSALPAADLESLIEEGPHPAEIVCHNCAGKYLFSRDDLIALRRR